MSKILPLLIALGFFGYILYKRFKMPKVTEAKSVPTGVKKITYFVVGIFLMLGSFISIAASMKLGDEVKRELEWTPAEGFVSEHVLAGFHKGRQAYYHRIHFQTSKETGSVDHDVIDVSRKTTSPEAVSSPIKVLYNPSNPDEAVANTFFDRWAITLIMLAASIFFIGFGIGAAWQIMKIQSLSQLGRSGPHAGFGEGRLLAVKKNFFLSLKNNPSWRLVVEYQDLAGRTYTAQSEPIWDYHPDTWVKKDLAVPLSIDRANPARAWVRVQDYFKACRA